MNRTRYHLSLLAVLAAMMIPSYATAGILPLSEILTSRVTKLSVLIADPEHQMKVGDKIFDNFTYHPIGDMPQADDVNVIPIVDAEGNYGIRFQGGFVDLPGGGVSEALITFDAAVMPASRMLISDAHLAMNGAVIGGVGFATITETFLPLVTDQLLTTYNFGPDNDAPMKLTDWLDFDTPVRKVSVQKDILLYAGPLPGTPPGTRSGVVTLSLIDQTFSQVPEPASWLLILSGLGGFALIRRRNR